VLTVAVPVLIDAFTPRNSSLEFAYHGASDRSITVLVTNKGVRPGSVQLPVSFNMLNRTRQAKDAIPGLNDLPLYLAKLRETTSLLVDPSKSVLMELEPMPSVGVASVVKDRRQR
jgi:hypothetical protein